MLTMKHLIVLIKGAIAQIQAWMKAESQTVITITIRVKMKICSSIIIHKRNHSFRKCAHALYHQVWMRWCYCMREAKEPNPVECLAKRATQKFKKSYSRKANFKALAKIMDSYQLSSKVEMISDKNNLHHRWYLSLRISLRVINLSFG